MRRLRCAVALVAGSALVAACARTFDPAPCLRPGSDRDAHGCIGSAGYRWCAARRACVRPWTVASSAVDFDAQCANPPAGGSGAQADRPVEPGRNAVDASEQRRR